MIAYSQRHLKNKPGYRNNRVTFINIIVSLNKPQRIDFLEETQYY